MFQRQNITVVLIGLVTRDSSTTVLYDHTLTTCLHNAVVRHPLAFYKIQKHLPQTLHSQTTFFQQNHRTPEIPHWLYVFTLFFLSIFFITVLLWGRRLQKPAAFKVGRLSHWNSPSCRNLIINKCWQIRNKASRGRVCLGRGKAQEDVL